MRYLVLCLALTACGGSFQSDANNGLVAVAKVHRDLRIVFKAVIGLRDQVCVDESETIEQYDECMSGMHLVKDADLVVYDALLTLQDAAGVAESFADKQFLEAARGLLGALRNLESALSSAGVRLPDEVRSTLEVAYTILNGWAK